MFLTVYASDDDVLVVIYAASCWIELFQWSMQFGMMMMKGEMDIALIIEVVIGQWREAVIEGDLQAPIEERGVALIMAAVLVLTGERGAALIMAVGAVEVPLVGRGLAPIMVVHVVVVLIEERGLALTIVTVLTIVLTKQRG
jgi:hypothetical protein